ncbi:ethanolamine utilization protein EutP [Enterococcus sp. PF1-24]|uniref:EutP/PduV family microcompartment system protein n=1 Tax=unclassified Enterococcus TaxID=2608891 RepID=UPI00247596C8|nr:MULTISPECIES: EutP/PduV family microcompartment system protein [unclassified Enterococcus]MDH6365601.1 ethanolamine utilization protein EutP [Enterococcus sp. PFB1-1]MDH6402703.1 ethanolamine utilization protein EutP [Enterococcus sp. PF1-24]
MQKIIFIGETGCGKTTLSQWLQKKERVYHKTQQVYYFDDSIDTPGEFMENRFYYNALVSASVDAKRIAFVQSVKGSQNYFPPYFSSRFTKPTIGIITKVDLISNEEELINARKYLTLAGAKEIFEVSVVDGTGLAELEAYLFAIE